MHRSLFDQWFFRVSPFSAFLAMRLLLFLFAFFFFLVNHPVKLVFCGNDIWRKRSFGELAFGDMTFGETTFGKQYNLLIRNRIVQKCFNSSLKSRSTDFLFFLRCFGSSSKRFVYFHSRSVFFGSGVLLGKVIGNCSINDELTIGVLVSCSNICKYM